MRVRATLAAPPLVGREPELALLRSRLEAACAGEGGVVLLVGEAGIGKTRLAEELARLAEARGAAVLWGRATEAHGAPAFWPWLHVLRACAADEGGALDAVLGADGATLTSLLSQQAGDAPSGTAGEELSAGPDAAAVRFRVFEGVAGVLTRAAQRRPLLVVLDDLHWADAASLLCLQFLAGEIGAHGRTPLLVLGAFREGELERTDSRTRILAALARDGRVRRITLAGLGEEEVAALAAALLDETPGEVGAGLVQMLARETEGNPFFIQELVRELADSGRLGAGAAQPGDERPPLPAGIRELLGRSLARLSPDCLRVLTFAAVLGQEFRLALLTRAAALAELPILAALDEALAARVIAAVPGAMGRYRFRHALIREAIYEQTPLPERVRLHRQAGAALEEISAATDSRIEELAHHFSRATPGGDAEKAVRYARRAGEVALSRYAYEEAARFYGLALEALDLAPTPGEEERCALLLAQGDALDRAGETVAARERLLLAAEVARALSAPEALARAALMLAGLQQETGRVDEERVALLEEALAGIESGESATRALLLAQLAKARSAHPRAPSLAREAIAIARGLGEARVLIDVLFVTRYVLWTADNLAERLEHTAEMVRLAQELGEIWWLKVAHAFRFSDLLERGDRDGAAASMAIVSRREQHRQTAHERWYELVLKAMQELMAGRLAAGEQLAWQALAAGQEAQIPDALQSFGVQIAYVRYMQGRFGELEGTFRGLVEQYPDTPSWRAGLAVLYTETGRPAETREQLERLAAGGFGAFPRDRSWLIGLANTAEACAFAGDRERATLLYDLLLPYAEQNIMIALATVWYGPVARQLGLLAETLGRPEAAARHFEEALAMLARMVSPPFTARVQAEYAALLLRSGQDESRARALLAEATATARELGLGRVLQIAEGLVAAPPTPAGNGITPPRTTLPDGLTAREAEVLALLAQGHSNQAIAEALVLSPFTVARHITNLYTKIGARGRADATAYALRNGLG